MRVTVGEDDLYQVVEYNDVYQFDYETRDFLLRHESENNLILGITQILCDPCQEYFASSFLYTVRDKVESQIHLVAVWTPIYNLCVSVCDMPVEDKQKIFHALQRHMLSRERIFSGLFAQKDDAKLFAKMWSEQCARMRAKPTSFSTKMSERLYELRPIDLKVDSPQQQYEISQQQKQQNNAAAATTTTTMNHSHLVIERMSMDDYETCLNWMVHFQQESGFYSNVPKELIRKLNQNRLDLLVKNDCIYTLRDISTGKVVSMSAVNAETPNGGRVGWVYTPLEHRGKGYSQQCVAKMCEKVFREKRKTKLFLFADLANRAANHLYKKIGFKEVCDVDNLSFSYEELLKSNL